MPSPFHVKNPQGPVLRRGVGLTPGGGAGEGGGDSEGTDDGGSALGSESVRGVGGNGG